MQSPTPPFKLTLTKQPSQLLAITEVSGSNNPGDCDGNPGPGSGNPDTLCGDAAWLDAVWEGSTGPTAAVDSENGRLQNRMGKTQQQGERSLCGRSLRRLTGESAHLGTVLGSVGNPPGWTQLPNGKEWDASISKPAYDSQVWSSKQE